MERTTDKHSARVDDAMEHEVQSLVDGRGGESRSQESRMAEPVAEGEVEINPGARHDDHDDQGIGVSRVTADDRADLARFVASAHWPATREDLLEAADGDHATDRIMETLGRLPHGSEAYENLQAVWKALGGEVEDGHTH
ncbi:MAG TPA: DUF2795 domain-containing protein [Acidimicrobiales bacterium]|nr:DUF2795 domain-containing protein [Acidimicrobiales bacterium]